MENSPTPAQQNFVWHSAGSPLYSNFTGSFPKAPDMNLILIAAELYMDADEHDRLVLHFKGHLLEEKEALISEDPVVFTFSAGAITSTWYGYINSVDTSNTVQSGNTDIICLGASYILKKPDQKIYKNITADQVLTQIAKSNGLEAITQRHPRVKDWVQAGQSQWQMLRRLANQTGFALRADNTTIYFVSKTKIFNNGKKTAAYFNYVDNKEIAGVITKSDRYGGTIVKFTPRISDKSPESGVRVDRVITGIDPNTGKVISVTHPYTKPSAAVSGVVTPSEGYFN
jgi:phosphopantetheine adenylyltransferase